ncbi:MAG TPA: nucleotide pyrophosphohydrolase [Spirochaetia bacterium]|nr:nucleotide pyrophosphohydrolase [Spirochaetia bacterium]
MKDSSYTINCLKDIVKVFCEERDWDKFHNPKDLAIGIVTEASEVIEHFRFKSLEEIETMFSDKDKKQEIAEELSDVLFFVLRFAQMYNIDLSAEFLAKIEKNQARYPVVKCKGSNKKYTEA